jgi:hypothetical protein
MSDCPHAVTRMTDLTITETCATAAYACALCGLPVFSESHNLELWGERAGPLLDKLRAEFQQPDPAQAGLF